MMSSVSEQAEFLQHSREVIYTGLEIRKLTDWEYVDFLSLPTPVYVYAGVCVININILDGVMKKDTIMQRKD